MRRALTLTLLAAAGISSFATRATAATTVAAVGDASITRNDATGTWTLAAGHATLSLVIESTLDFTITTLQGPSGRLYSIGVPDSLLKIGAQTVAFGNRAAGFVLNGVTVAADGNRLQLNATYDLNAAGLRVTRHYAIVSGTPTFEAWTTYTPAGGSPSLSDLNALQFVVPAGAVHSLTGLRGDSADTESESAFTLSQTTVANGQRFAIGSKARSSEQSVPWVAIDGAQDEFYAALMWSGAWSIAIVRNGGFMTLTAGLDTMTTTLRGPVDGPHVVFGAAKGGLSQASAALRSFVINGLRGGNAMTPLVTYNTWFAYGVSIDEASMRAEMEGAAALGAELFVIDAGWYPDAGANDAFDFESGLGVWTPDPARFPNGLKPLRDYAHQLGMKFGLWVEPERVNLDVVGDVGLDERLLAKTGGSYGSERTGLLCLANAAARQWVLDQLTSLLDQVQPDYLKWDNNMWVNCDRGGHEHGAADGNFAQVNGLYDVLSTLRDQYPGLLTENVSGGGNRLDLGMARYTDVAWMDDRTAPSVHVRHNVEGLSAVFPPAYLLSFVTDHEGEPLHESPDVSLYMRSRMAGALGLCFRSADFTEGDNAGIAHEIAIYKEMRSTVSDAAGALLTAQAAADNGPAWDVLQETAADGGQVLLCAYQTDMSVGSFTVKPNGLAPTETYRVVSVDTGALGTATGADLMRDGIGVLQSPNTAAHILILTIQR